MYNTSKICDAADWFDPEIKFIIENELREPARFHRKQWEFAMIFLTLKKFGLLNYQKVGLSLGGGNERVLYSIANHVKKLFVTDLYDEGTTWDCARTTDPDEFIKLSKPFPVADDKFKALRMDMRYIDFQEDSFDFCYSSCAIEHIGEYQDFLQHLNEVNRVLKPGGIYIFTTEMQFGEKTISDQNNFIFTKEYLSELIANSDLDFVSDVDTTLTRNQINLPNPTNLKNLSYTGKNFINEKLFEQFPHLILLRGSVPFTSVLLILRKGTKNKKSEPIGFLNYDVTKKFLLEGVGNYRRLIEENKISISPFSMLPDGVSSFFIDHSDYFTPQNKNIKSNDSIFHSDYFWLGNGEREVRIKFKVNEVMISQPNVLQLRVHAYSIYRSSEVECVFEKNITLIQNQEVDEIIKINTNEEYNFAFLCKLVSGNVSCSSISIESSSVNYHNKYPIPSMELDGVTEL
jgi:SAM-dependent methyltransferase